MNVRSALDLINRDRAVYEISDSGGIVLRNPQKFIAQTLDLLVWNAVFGENDEVRNTARWIIRRAGLELGVIPSSIQGLYEARGRKEVWWLYGAGNQHPRPELRCGPGGFPRRAAFEGGRFHF